MLYPDTVDIRNIFPQKREEDYNEARHTFFKMRITGGRASGITLKVASTEILRPATDFLRTRIFNILDNDLNGAHVLDCFAGTGAYGLEALSRGAHKVDFIENNSQIFKIMQENIERVCKSLQKETTHCRVFRQNIFNWASLTPYTHIFFDPPYPFWETYYKKLLALLAHLAHANSTALLVLEKPNAHNLPPESGWQPNTQLGKNPTSASIGIYRCHQC